MTYEYENDVVSELKQMGVDYQSNGYFNMSIELEEIYRKAKAFDEIKERFEKEYKAEVFEESLYHPENFDNSEFLIDVEHILYFEDVRYVEIKEDE